MMAEGVRDAGSKGVQRERRGEKGGEKTREALCCVAAPGCCFPRLPRQPQERGLIS